MGACFHIAGVTCDNCRQMTAPSVPHQIVFVPTVTVPVTPGTSALPDPLRWALVSGALWQEIVQFFGPHAECNEGDCDLSDEAAVLARRVMEEERRRGR